MKKVILIFAMLPVFNVVADESEEAICLYEGKPYAAGSIIEMVGIKRECRDGSYEHSQYMESNKESYKYISPGAYDHTYAWRAPTTTISNAIVQTQER